MTKMTDRQAMDLPVKKVANTNRSEILFRSRFFSSVLSVGEAQLL